MSPSNITPDQILDAIQRVPVQRWSEMMHAIESLQDLPVSPTPSSSPVWTGTDLRGSALIGIWADRVDIGSSHEFTRGLRREAEQRTRQGPSDASGH